MTTHPDELVRMFTAKLGLAAVALAVLAACSAGSGEGTAFEDPSGNAMSEVPTTVGDTVLFSPFPLSGPPGTGEVTLVGVDVSGDGVATDVADVDLAGYYPVSPGGLIGTARGGGALHDARQRLLPAGSVVTIPSGDGLAFVVAVRGLKKGVWRADYVNLHYTINGEKRTQRIRYALGVCVVAALEDPCDAGLPQWWNK